MKELAALDKQYGERAKKLEAEIEAKGYKMDLAQLQKRVDARTITSAQLDERNELLRQLFEPSLAQVVARSKYWELNRCSPAKAFKPAK